MCWGVSLFIDICVCGMKEERKKQAELDKWPKKFRQDTLYIQKQERLPLAKKKKKKHVFIINYFIYSLIHY